MQEIIYRCQSCNHTITIKDNAAIIGDRIRCPVCKSMMFVKGL